MIKASPEVLASVQQLANVWRVMKRMDTLAKRVHTNATAEGFDEVIMPGPRIDRVSISTPWAA